MLPWERAIKTNFGKLNAARILGNFEQRVLHPGASACKPFSDSNATRSGLLPFHHRDPFERLWAAQSLEHNLWIGVCHWSAATPSSWVYLDQRLR